ncbi:sulfatase family protein [Streptomyces sp. NPDC054786]
MTSCNGGTDSASSGGDQKASSSSPADSPGANGGSPDANGGSPDANGGKKPNILYVLTDDLSWNLVKYMPHVQQLMQKGTTFSNFFATDSQCCPSRSSILTGEFPHNTGVYDNAGNDGGYGAFKSHGNEKKCFGARLQKAGYQTGFMGKYLNEYNPAKTQGTSSPFVPPGWNEWDVAGNGYPEYNYKINENHHVEKKGHSPQDYLTDVISDRATKFIDQSAKSHKPFMLETATFAPHAPATPAPEDMGKFGGTKAPENSAYGKATENAPKWQQSLKPLTDQQKASIDKKFRKRVRSVQAVDRMIGHLEQQLKANGQDKDTYLVFGSDNGFHMGEHNLLPGKQTIYDSDIQVPMMVTGPGVPANRKVSALAQNTDMNPTFQELAGLKPSSTSVDGRSLAGLMQGKSESDWRKSVLVEHHHADDATGDPDKQKREEGDPPDYMAIRTDSEVYAEYSDGEKEYYTPNSDPDETDNKIGSLSPAKRDALHKKLLALHHCKGQESCKKAAQ